ncbi:MULTISPECIES: hypothetical protein [Novosphingobium]|uniref:Helix-turn-helix domain-containing protein n=2 Tax=Novosphingobium TaxID=165696 RepID=A0ABT0A7P3_9SPHN|nr:MULTISPECIES: hypothetical protein [Novosphingobium]MCJ1959210.1 helix-turn-helix domain-containing protein [Novosphingobium mangrovi (ex Hu et al. 2023)]MED5546977.1 hypothetical protein [Pseudomonadota bacterium]QVM85693.1 hypothetical protein HT578_20075 [Novosphingobium decolorationis]
MTSQEQLTLFTRAVEALGGVRAVAQILGCSERSVGRLLTGEMALHEGWLRGVSSALLEHAVLCRKLERSLSPDFPSNLLSGQARAAGSGRREDGGLDAD